MLVQSLYATVIYTNLGLSLNTFFFENKIKNIFNYLNTYFSTSTAWVSSEEVAYTYSSKPSDTNSLVDYITTSGSEQSSEYRNQRFTNPHIRFNDKIGDYFPVETRLNFPFLFTSFTDLARAVRRSS